VRAANRGTLRIPMRAAMRMSVRAMMPVPVLPRVAMPSVQRVANIHRAIVMRASEPAGGFCRGTSARRHAFAGGSTRPVVALDSAYVAHLFRGEAFTPCAGAKRRQAAALHKQLCARRHFVECGSLLPLCFVPGAKGGLYNISAGQHAFVGVGLKPALTAAPSPGSLCRSPL
jgi:hypothetical protein